MRACTAPVFGIVHEINGPTLQLKVPRSPNMAAGPPDAADKPSVTLGYRSAVATPMRAVDAASVRSAWRMSGRRRNSAAPSPTGMVLVRRGAVAHCSSDAGMSLGVCPVSAARRYSAVRCCAWNGGRLACNCSSWLRARVTSSVVPRPARCRRLTASSDSFCTCTECWAEANCMPAAHIVA
ncbi:hypothetical protein D3C72_631340 [compost metagenome]